MKFHALNIHPILQKLRTFSPIAVSANIDQYVNNFVYIFANYNFSSQSNVIEKKLRKS
jgi:hypothetical protein